MAAFDFDKYNQIIFDFDGVIKDSSNIKTEAFVELYKDLDVDLITKIRKYHINNVGLSRYEKFKYIEENFRKKHYDAIIENKLSEIFSKIVFDKVCQAPYIKGVLKFISTLKKTNHKLFIASAAPEHELIRIIDNISINEFFDGIYGAPKKKVDIINTIKSKSSKDIDILFIGDAITDLDAAKEANIDFMGVDSKHNIFPSTIITISNFESLLGA